MKEELCKAFCGDLLVREVPDGMAVSTTFKRDDGDSIGFFIVPAGDHTFRLEDDGLTLMHLAEAGVDLSSSGTREKAFNSLLIEYGAFFDSDDGTIRTEPLPSTDLPRAAMRFVALLLRMDDFVLLTPERIASTFREDAMKRLESRLGGRAEIVEGVPVSDKLTEIIPDVVLRAASRSPVALFFGSSPQRVNDAIFLHMAATYETHEDVRVIALLESDSTVSSELRRRASNRLATVPVFRHDEEQAVARIAQEVVGSPAVLH